MESVKYKKISSLILSAIMTISMCFCINIQPVYAAPSAADMLKEAKKTKTDTQYVIVSSYSAYKTRIYGIDKKGNYKLIATYTSCGASDRHTGHFKLSDFKDRDRPGRGNAKNKYHYRYVRYYNKHGTAGRDCNAIHSVLYEKGSNSKYYHDTKNRVQDSRKLFKYHWSQGCTRLSLDHAKWIFDHCGKGTGYAIMK